MTELKITAANFENEVLRSDKPVLLDFYADWCGPCKMLSPILHELAEEKSGTLKVGKVNVDEQMELAMRFQVSSIPMLVVFKDGKAVAKSVGYRPKPEIAAMVESFWDRYRIDVRVRQEVTAINPTEKTVTVHALDSGKVYTETYDKLLLAPGAKPTVPALSGVSSERVFTLRTVEDTLRIRRFVEDQKPKTAVLAGGGFIGLEMAENLVEMGVSVTIVQRPKSY